MAINLIPHEEAQANQENVLKRGFIFGLMAILLAVLILGGRYLYEGNRLSNLELEEDDIKKQEASLKEYKESLERYKSHPALQILSNHTYYTKFLQKIEECVLPNMSLSSIKVDSGNKVNLSATLKGNYADVARFIKTLKEKGFINIKISTINKSDDGLISFSSDFDFSRSLILK